MPTDRVHLHSQQIPSRPHDHVTHRPMGTLPLPAADAEPASSRQALHPLRGATPVAGRYTQSEEVQCPRIGCTSTPNKYLHGHTITSHTVRWAHCHYRQPTQNRLHPGMRYTRYGALHPLRHATPVTSRYTRSEEVQCPQIGCSATPGKYRRGHEIQVGPRKHSRCLHSETSAAADAIVAG